MNRQTYPNLRAEMARRRITNEQVAEAVQVSPGTLSAKPNNPYRLLFREAAAIRDCFFPEMTLDYLFGPGKGGPDGEEPQRQTPRRNREKP